MAAKLLGGGGGASRVARMLLLARMLLIGAATDFRHECVHDAMRAKAPAPAVVSPPLAAVSRRERALVSAPPGLRIAFNAESMPTDTQTCRRVGQVVAVGAVSGPPCTSTSVDDCAFTCRTQARSAGADVDCQRSSLGARTLPVPRRLASSRVCRRSHPPAPLALATGHPD